MKKTIIILVVLITALIIGAQIFLAFGLTNTLRQIIVPMAHERWNIDCQFDRASVNLLRGSFSLRGARIMNPPGYTEPCLASLKNFRLKIGIARLFRNDLTEIQKAQIRNALIRLERNHNGELNIAPLLNALRQSRVLPAGAEGAAVAGQPQGTTAAQAKPPPRKLPNIIIKKAHGNATLDYTDHSLGKTEPFKLTVALQASLTDIANHGREDVLSGSFNLLGQISANGRQHAFDLHGRLAPVSDPTRPSFDASGAFQTLDLATILPLSAAIGFESGKMEGTVMLSCRNGMFDAQKSALRLAFTEVTPTEKLQQKLRGIPLPKRFKISIPIHGAFSKPHLDMETALLNMLANPDTLEAILKGIRDGKTP